MVQVLLSVLIGVAGVLALAYLWDRTIPQADAARRNPPTPSITAQAWNAAVFVTFLAVMAWCWWTWEK
jgi:hypothetical protein